MKLEPCIGCGRMILVQRVANLVVRCDPSPLDGQGVAEELGSGRQIWTPAADGRLKGAQPGDQKLLREHGCRASAAKAPSAPAAAPLPASPLTQAQSVLGGPARPGDGSTAPFSTSRRTNPLCDGCRRPVVLDGPELYMAMELGATVVWALHVDCGGR